MPDNIRPHTRRVFGFTCTRCGVPYSSDMSIDSAGCPACAKTAPANLRVSYGADSLARRQWPVTGHGISRFSGYLPVDAADMTSLGEGDTPLLHTVNLGAALGLERLYVKDESRNPTLSYKDRLSVVAVAAARRQNLRTVATASSGNAGASLAAYAAKAGLGCLVITSQGASGPMITQIRKFGATVLMLPTPADRWPVLARGVKDHGWFATSPYRAPVVGSHPVGIEGYKTIAYELVEQMDGRHPDWLVLPVCYGDALAGILQGFVDLQELGVISGLPRIVAAEAYGSLTQTLGSDSDCLADIDADHRSIAHSIGATQSSFQALSALRRSGGTAHAPGNEAIRSAQSLLAQSEGLFAELTSAAPIAAIRQFASSGLMRPSETVVALVTASGLKDFHIGAEDLEPLEMFTGTAAQADALVRRPVTKV